MSEQALPSSPYTGPEEGTLKRIAILAVLATIAALAVVGPASSQASADQEATRIYHWDHDPNTPTSGVDMDDGAAGVNLSQGCSGFANYDKWVGRIKVEPRFEGFSGEAVLDYALGQIWVGNVAVHQRWSTWGGVPPSAGTKAFPADGEWHSFNYVLGIGDEAAAWTATSVTAFVRTASINVKNVKIKVKPGGCVFDPPVADVG